MPSVVDVVNRSLDKLGHPPITSLSDGNRAANLATRTWPIIRNKLLRSHPWNFAIKRVSLAPLSEAPAWGFNNAFQLPSDLLRIIELDGLSTGDYQVEDGRILCNDSVIYLRYVSKVEDPNKYDTLFVELAATTLAYEMCEALTQSNTKKQLLGQEIIDIRYQARFTDAVENPPVMIEEDSWVEVRT